MAQETERREQHQLWVPRQPKTESKDKEVWEETLVTILLLSEAPDAGSLPQLSLPFYPRAGEGRRRRGGTAGGQREASTYSCRQPFTVLFTGSSIRHVTLACTSETCPNAPVLYV